MNDNYPSETEGREDYYDAALVCITLICDSCRATLDPDIDLGPNASFESPGYFVLLGDEAYRRSWKIRIDAHGDFSILCPECAKRASATSFA